MTTVKLRRRRRSPTSGGPLILGSLSPSTLCLLFALSWPLLFYLLCPSSSPSSPKEGGEGGLLDRRPSTVRGRAVQLGRETRDAARHLLHKAEFAGYGPAHPRVGIVIVGQCGNGDNKKLDPKRSVLDTASSVFATTDRNRILVVTVVMDGCSNDEVSGLKDELDDVDSGEKGAHRHGDEVHSHPDGKEAAHEKGQGHGRKVHLIVNPPPSRGIGSARAEGASFVQILARKHEEAGLKDPDEDVLLLLLRAGTILEDAAADEDGGGGGAADGGTGDKKAKKKPPTSWLDAVTSALIVPPAPGLSRILHPRRHAGDAVPHPTKLSNAVSFLPDLAYGTLADSDFRIFPAKAGKGGLSVDRSLSALINREASADELARSDGDEGGESYPTPVINGWAVAMRLETYLNLPASDAAFSSTGGLSSPAAADLELSLNLWLCADGADVLPKGARAAIPADEFRSGSNRALAAEDSVRLVAAWGGGSSGGGESDGGGGEGGGMGAGVKDLLGLGAKEAEELDRRVRELRQIGEDEEGDAAALPANLGKKCRGLDYFADLAGWLASDDGEAASNHGAKKAKDPKKEELHAFKKELRDKNKEWAKAERKKAKDKMEREGALHRNMDENETVGHEAHRKPAKPLSKTNLDIVNKAGQIDMKFVPVPNGKDVDHPHKGAKDEKGNWGYVHDASALRLNPPPPFKLKDEKERKTACKKKDAEHKMLMDKPIVVDTPAHEAAERSHHKRAKLMCIVYTIEKYHDKIPTIRETWGRKCDGFIVASTKTDKALGTVEIPHEGAEEYSNIYQKVRAIWSYVYDHYYDEYDYFHIGGDDMYVLVENLRLYLESDDVRTAQNGGVYLPQGGPADGDGGKQTPLFLGRRMAENGDMNRVFNSGGSGYALNRAALKTLVQVSFPNCMPHFHTFSEDVLVAQCLRKHGVVPYDTKDEMGGERYMPFNPGHHYKYRPPADITEDWYSHYSIDVKWGLDHCASKAIAFHYISPELMRRMHALLYGYCS